MKFDHRFELIEASPSTRVYGADGVTMRLDFFENMLRVALLRPEVPLVPTWSVCPDGREVPLEGRDKLSTEGFSLICPEVTEDEKTLCFSLGGADFAIEKKNFRITARNEKGVLYADRSGLAYNFDGEPGEGAAHYTRREESERIMKDKAYLESVYKEGAAHAQYLANKTLSKVYRKIGFIAK